jgi:hypothetical protein
VEEVAAIEESLEEVETMAEAPSPEISNEPAAVVPRPAPVPVVGAGEGDYGTGSSGGGGGIIGVVIRGGGVDGDNCELHRRGRGGVAGRGPIYVPRPPYPTTGGGITVGRRIPQTSVPDRRLPTGTARGMGARIRGR